MPTLFDDHDEPAMRRLTRGELIGAYAEELHQRPPVRSCAGDGPEFDKQRLAIAGKDIARLYAAAARLGCTLQLVPLPASNVHLNAPPPPADNEEGRP